MLGAVPRRPLLTNAAGVDAEMWERAKDGLRWYFTRYGDDITRNFAARYAFSLERFRDSWGEDIYEWHYVPLELKLRQGPEKYRDARGQKTGVFKPPRSRVVEEIPQAAQWAYRGMSWEEWADIRKHSRIQSRGTHNIGEGQKGLTLFSEKADPALFYATGFAPIGYKPAKRRPGVVIAIPRELTLGSNEDDWTQRPGSKMLLIPAGERALVGPLSTDALEAVWYAIPHEARAGFMEVWYRHGSLYAKQPWTQGSASGVDLRVTVMQAHPEEMLS